MDFENQISQALRRQQDAQGRSQYQAPQGRMAGRVYVAPNALEYMASLLRSAGAGAEAQMAGKEAQQLTQQRSEGTQKALADFLRQSQGQAAITLPEDQAGPVLPAQAPDMRAAYGSLLQAPDAGLRQMGVQGMAQIPQLEAQQREREIDRQFRAEEAQRNREQRQLELQQRLEDARLAREDRANLQRELTQLQIDSKKYLAGLVQSNRPQPNAQIVQTENGPMQLVDGRAVPIVGPDNKPVRGPRTERTSEEQKRVNDASDVLSILNDAEKLLDKATGSYAGTAIDEGARIFGLSTPGAQSAAELKALQGILVSKMPKMSGPQSDKDVLLYREMAGQIGDPTIPAATKRAAINTIRRLNERYAGVPEGSSVPGATQLSPQDQQALDWANSNPNDPRSAEIKKRLQGR